MRTPPLRTPALLLPILAACTAPGAARRAELELLAAGLGAPTAAEREAAVEELRSAPPAAVAAVGPWLASGDPDVVRAASLALEGMVHEAARPRKPGEDRALLDQRRRELAGKLLDLVAATGESGTPVLPAAERRRVLRILSLVVLEPEHLRRTAGFLEDPDLQEGALYVLERAPHPEADRILLERLQRRAAPGQAALARVLGNRRSQAAVPALLALLDDDDAGPAARHALARIGSPQALGPLLAAVEAGDSRAAPDLLLLADNLLNQGAGRRVRGIGRVWEALGDSPDPNLRAAALELQARSQGLDAMSALLAALEDPADPVCGLARDLLAALPGAEVTDRILVTLEEARPPVRAQLLEVLARRRDPEAAATVRRFLTDPAPEVRLAALRAARLTPDAGLRTALAGVLADDGHRREERAAAAAALLAQAEELHRQGLGNEAGELYRQILAHRGVAGAATVADAMEDLAALGRPADASILQAVAAEAGRDSPAAERALVTLSGVLVARERSLDTAQEFLAELCTTSPSRSVRQDAARLLRRLGVDTSGLARKAGFLVHWHLDGPHPLPAEGAFGESPFPPEGPDVEGWRDVVTEDLDGVVDLLPLFEKHEQVSAWAWTTFTLEDAADAELRIGSDDGVAVWLDGKLVHQNDVYRGLSVDQDRVPVHLEAGRHTLLLRITQGGGDWRFCVRLTTPDGRPLRPHETTE